MGQSLPSSVTPSVSKTLTTDSLATKSQGNAVATNNMFDLATSDGVVEFFAGRGIG